MKILSKIKGHVRIKRLLLMVVCLLMMHPLVYASEVDEQMGNDMDTVIEDQLNTIDFDEVDKLLEGGQLTEFFSVDSFKDLIAGITSGEIDFSFIALSKSFIQYLLREIKSLTVLLGEILVLCTLSQILKNLDISFKDSSVSEIGFYVVYMTLILLLFKSFNIVMNIVSASIGEIHLLMKTILPTMIMLVLASGNVTAGAAQGSLILFTLDILVNILRNYIVPIVYFIVMLEMVNHISKQDILSHLLGWIKQIINKALKYVVIVFAFLMSISNITAPMVDGIINKGAKYAVGSIPVVGSALSGVVDTVLNCSVLIKNSVGIGAILIILIICLMPIIKLLAISFIYKIGASLVQPMSDERIVKALSSMGDYSGLLLGVLVTVMLLFIAAIAILVVTTNITMMIR